MALAFVVGNAFALRLPFPVEIAVVATVLLLAVAWLLRARAVSSAFLYAAIVTVGCASALLALAEWGSGIAGQMDQRREHVKLRGVVAYEPISYNESEQGHSTRYYFPLKIKEVLRKRDWQESRGKVWVRLDSAPEDPQLSYGDLWELDGVLTRRRGEGGTVGSKHALVYTVERGGASLVSRGNGSKILSYCLEMRRSAANVLTRGLEQYPRQAGMLKALLLGYREELDRDIYNRFAATGTIHILAISGLHVGLIAGIIVILLRCLGIPRTRWYLFLAPLLLMYTMGTGLRASALRAATMAIVYWSAPAFGRKPDALCSLALTTLIILAIEPFQIVDPGFQFSFIIVGGIILLLPFMQRAEVGVRLRQPEPWRIQAEPKLVVFIRQKLERLYFLATVTVAAWIVSMPLIVYYGNIFSPVALVGNLLVVPLTGLVVATGALSLLFGSAVALLAEIFNHANRVFLTGLLEIVDAMAKVPFGHLFLESPPLWFIPLYYLLLAAIVLARTALQRYMASISLVLVVVVTFGAVDFEESHMVVRRNGRCVSALIDLKRSSDVLVNCGSIYSERKIRQWLRSEGVNRLRRLILTQVDTAHAGGLEELLDNFRVDEIWIPAYRSHSPVYQKLLEMVEQRGLVLRRLKGGPPFELSQDILFEVFNPLENRRARSSAAAALVFRIAYEERGAIFAGTDRLPPDLFDQPKDIEAPAWILESAPTRRKMAAEVFRRTPATVVLGGDVNPNIRNQVRGRTEVWSLDQQGEVKIEL